MAKKILVTTLSLIAVVGGITAMSAFESHIINVTAHIENALRVHSTAYDFGTVFPQENFNGNNSYEFSIETSDSFSDPGQTRVLNIDYTITRKPKPIDPSDHEYCYSHRNDNPKPADYYTRCYASMCASMSAHPIFPVNDPKDAGFDSYTNPDTVIGTGTLHKKVILSDPLPDNKFDIWNLDLSVPCFKGECAQDWNHPGYEIDPTQEGKTFGCDLWVEVNKIY